MVKVSETEKKRKIKAFNLTEAIPVFIDFRPPKNSSEPVSIEFSMNKHVIMASISSHNPRAETHQIRRVSLPFI